MINRVVLVGRLTRDPELRKTTSGTDISRFTVACDRRVPKNSQNNQPTADFISCIAFNQPAEFLSRYGAKGMLVAVDGRIQTGSYDHNGQKVYTTDIIAENVRVLERKEQPQAQYQPQAQPPQNNQQTQPVDPFFGGLEIDPNDLPF